MRDFRRNEEHRGSILASGDTGSAGNTGGGIHGSVRFQLSDRQRIGIGSAAGVDGYKSSRLNDAVKSAAVADQIFDDGKSLRAPGFDGEGSAIFKFAHMELANRGTTLRSVRNAIDHERTGSADSLAAVRIKLDRQSALLNQLF